MRINEANGIRGWIAFISSGTTLGLIASIFLFNYFDEKIAFDIIITGGITGGIIGWLIAYVYSRKTNLNTAYISLYQSTDLDDFYNKTNDPKLEKRFLKSVIRFSDNELITSLAMRYTRLSDNCTNTLIEQIHDRSLSRKKVRNLYTSKKYYKDLTSEDCPCCESSQHVIIKNKKVIFCLVCGFNIKYDNPKSLLNKFRWKVGFYSQSKLSLKEVENLVFCIK